MKQVAPLLGSIALLLAPFFTHALPVNENIELNCYFPETVGITYYIKDKKPILVDDKHKSFQVSTDKHFTVTTDYFGDILAINQDRYAVRVINANVYTAEKYSSMFSATQTTTTVSKNLFSVGECSITNARGDKFYTTSEDMKKIQEEWKRFIAN
ncbi:hypothetical protein GNP44_11880 [Aliivibrio fischeri]|uniref:hypothetical protein n=1 Tax=Aliivibrio fischeri TaxID=668 RepID=UPI0012D93C06|nr:hypothetical protein [Aliivibrio fischeri]MUK30773.1 hypothetical protein [Aliivibrio fischeri]